MIRQNPPNLHAADQNGGKHEVPVGSELLIALTLGLAGWWAIVHAVIWIAGR